MNFCFIYNRMTVKEKISTHVLLERSCCCLTLSGLIGSYFRGLWDFFPFIRCCLALCIFMQMVKKMVYKLIHVKASQQNKEWFIEKNLKTIMKFYKKSVIIDITNSPCYYNNIVMVHITKTRINDGRNVMLNRKHQNETDFKKVI